MYKFILNALPECFTNYYTRNSSFYGYSTRSVKNDLYHAIQVNKTKTQQSIKILVVKIWNDVPSEPKCSSKFGFKVLVKKKQRCIPSDLNLFHRPIVALCQKCNSIRLAVKSTGVVYMQ